LSSTEFAYKRQRSAAQSSLKSKNLLRAPGSKNAT